VALPHGQRPHAGQTSAAATAAAYPEPMTHAHELSADDPDALSQAVTRAAAGEHVRLVAADGRRVADVVPPAPAETDAEKADRVTRAFFAATGGAVPTLDHYRRVYVSAGKPWPGDDVARTLFPFADAS
jgi:antitoxin (DNA-binding transcriptional repressor) of toxin-antitoxin stability system